MELVFVCPQTGDTFKSADYKVTDNHGVKTDPNGNRTLDAKVALNAPCPACGQIHIYDVNELSCPFNSQ